MRIRVISLYQCVVSGTFHLMKEGLYSLLIILCSILTCIYRGGWDTEGVTVVSNDINSSTITCNSTHLTSFAVLVDVSGGHQVSLSMVVLNIRDR